MSMRWTTRRSRTCAFGAKAAEIAAMRALGRASRIRNVVRTLVGTAALVASAVTVDAELILLESFEYGAANFLLTPTTNTMAGGTGMAGSWRLYNHVNNRAAYVASGLTFTNLLTSGGAIRMEGQYSSSSLVSRQSAVTHTGVLYGSFLVKPGAQPQANPNVGVSFLGIGANVANEYNTDMCVSTKQWNHSTPLCGAKIGRSGGAPYSASGSALAYNNTTTYLMLFKFTNVGGTGNKTAAFWCLTAEQFGHFRPRASDPLTEAELNAASLGTGNTQVLQRGSETRSLDAVFNTTRYINLITSPDPGAAVWYMTYDEPRFSNASLNETVPLISVGTVVLVR